MGFFWPGHSQQIELSGRAKTVTTAAAQAFFYFSQKKVRY
jgi:pyridoxine/pyridoxamine 5'-phosphate oxidase